MSAKQVSEGDMRLYWSRMRVPVTFHLQRDWCFEWRCIYGISMGSWFFGAFKAETESLRHDGQDK